MEVWPHIDSSWRRGHSRRSPAIICHKNHPKKRLNQVAINNNQWVLLSVLDSFSVLLAMNLSLNQAFHVFCLYVTRTWENRLTFSVTGYIPSIWNNFLSHLLGLVGTVKEGFSSRESFFEDWYSFMVAFSVISFSAIDQHPVLSAQLLTLSHHTY